jgi:hypothetical protein
MCTHHKKVVCQAGSLCFFLISGRNSVSHPDWWSSERVETKSIHLFLTLYIWVRGLFLLSYAWKVLFFTVSPSSKERNVYEMMYNFSLSRLNVSRRCIYSIALPSSTSILSLSTNRTCSIQTYSTHPTEHLFRAYPPEKNHLVYPTEVTHFDTTPLKKC